MFSTQHQFIETSFSTSFWRNQRHIFDDAFMRNGEKKAKNRKYLKLIFFPR